jgi:HTH-type transcriptional regulator/antitoxin HigA
MRTDNYVTNYAPHPGLTLAENLEKLNMSQSELAKRIGRPEKTISEIVKGITAITPETALQLERALNISAGIWNKLEVNYQENKARIESRKKLQGEVSLAENYPYKEMALLKWVKETKDKIERVEELLKFFGVNSLGLVSKVIIPNTNPQIAFRKHKAKTISQESLAAWIRKGELEGVNVQTKEFDEYKLKELLTEIKKLTFEKDFDKLLIQLKEKFAECGIALIYVHDLSNTYVCGSTRWISPNKALIQLSLRGKYSDIMWFTLFHELGHILLHGKRERFIDVDEEYKTESVSESQADNFASEQLIPDRLLSTLMQMDETHIKNFAQRLEIHPGIVVGRLHHKKYLEPHMNNDLRFKF